jgi:hypothetical protein
MAKVFGMAKEKGYFCSKRKKIMESPNYLFNQQCKKCWSKRFSIDDVISILLIIFEILAIVAILLIIITRILLLQA